jgi:hypothetical protein
VTWHPRKKHLEEATDHLAEVGPEGGPPSPIGLVVGPVGLSRVPPQPNLQKVLPPHMRINLTNSLGQFDQTAQVYPSGLYKQPPCPLAEASANLSLHTPDQVVKLEILCPRNTI